MLTDEGGDGQTSRKQGVGEHMWEGKKQLTDVPDY